MKALVLDANASAAVAVVQSLGRKGVEVHAAAHCKCLAFSSRFAARTILYPSRPEEPEFLDWLRDLHRNEDYDLIVPTAEPSLLALQGCEDGDILRRKAVLAARTSVDIALDKAETWGLARRLGIAAPDARVISLDGDDAYEGRYPVVLKATRSQVIRGGGLVYAPACIARDAAARESYLENWLRYSPIQQQAFFVGSGWGIECLYANGRLQWSFAHERLHETPLTGGASTYRQSAACPEHLLEASRRLLDALKWHGVAMVEFRVASDGHFALLEINPRFWGSLALAIRSGVDFPWGLYQLGTDGDPGDQPRYRTGYRMRILHADISWMGENLRANRSDPLLLTRPPLLSAVEWMRPLLGTESWDHFYWRDPAPGLLQIGAIFQRLGAKVAARGAQAIGLLEMRWRHARNLRALGAAKPGSRRLMFVCYGNICRSPLAEYAARRGLPDWQISSTGLRATTGSCTPARIRKAAIGEGIQLEEHRARRALKEHVDDADIVVIMDPLNYRLFSSEFPDAKGKILFLGMFGNPPSLNVPDPIDLDAQRATSSARLTIEAVGNLIRWLKS